jgi:hypothetical protein
MEWRRLGGGGPMRPTASTRGPDRPAAISAVVELSGLRSRKPAATATSCFDYSDPHVSDISCPPCCSGSSGISLRATSGPLPRLSA